MHDDQLLVVRHTPTASFMALPGGHLEWGETPHECIEREILEELGVAPKIGRLLYVYTFIDSNNTHSTEFFFEVLNGNDFYENNLRTGTHIHEIEEIHWIRPTDDVRILPQKVADDFRARKIGTGELCYPKG